MVAANIKTERLTLRPLVAGDEAALVAALDDFAVSKWLAVVPFPYEAVDFRHFLGDLAQPGETWAIDDAEGFAGVIGLDAQLGYWLARRAHGLGYMTEAARAVLADYFADDGAPEVTSGYFEGNGPSSQVLAKLGFLETGRAMKDSRPRGCAVPHVDLILTRAAFVQSFPLAARSARLAYRPLQPFDLGALHALVSDWQVASQLGSFPWPPDRDFTVTRAKPFRGDGFAWAILHHGALIGTVAVTAGELGYMIAPAYWRQGYGGEAVGLALHHSFLSGGPDRLAAEVWADNAVSLALLEKFGFTVTARMVEYSRARKVDLPSVTLHLSRADWEKANAVA